MSPIHSHRYQIVQGDAGVYVHPQIKKPRFIHSEKRLPGMPFK